MNEKVTKCRDPKDDLLLSLAVSGKADCVITGDRDLLILEEYRHIPIYAPAVFIDIYMGR